jgi:hypothetical protein
MSTKEASMRAPVALALFLAVAAGLAAPASLPAQTFDSGSTGADGALAPASGTVTLPLPPSGVFNFTTISIPAGVTLRFTRNAANTPVTLLASGAVTIAGTIDIRGAGGGGGGGGTPLASNGGVGGPGGFDGGAGANGIASTVGASGLGPGGGIASGGSGGGGSFATSGTNASNGGLAGPVYGTETLLPLIGGSGGAGGGGGLGSFGAGGGGGGGAILIASSGTITFTGSILASGGGGASGGPQAGGGGAGGAVRLLATTITGNNGSIDVRGGNLGSVIGALSGAGGNGRIRVEAFTRTAILNVNNVAPSLAQPSVVALSNAPVLTIASVAGIAAPPAPAGSFSLPDITLPAATTNPVAVVLSGVNIPSGTTVTLTVTGQTGGSTSTTATLTGSLASTSATASVTIPTNRPSVLLATVTFTLTAGGGGPVFVEGEPVERVRVTAAYGGEARVTYVTRSGREIVAAAR